MIGRRGFFKLLGSAAVGAMIPLPAPAEPVNLSVPFTWDTTRVDFYEDKIAMIKAMMARAIQAHDDMLEQQLFSSYGDSHDIRGLAVCYDNQYDWTS